MWTGMTSDCFVEPDWRVPGVRPNRAEMSRAAFLQLVAAWCGALTTLLLVAVAIRIIG